MKQALLLLLVPAPLLAADATAPPPSPLVLVPLGALMITFFRNVVGVKTFGTFVPLLLAMAFRELDLLAGGLTLAGVLVIGLGSRQIVGRLQLLPVARLSLLLTLVVVLSLPGAMGLVPLKVAGPGAGLPMFILALTVERLALGMEDEGRRETAKNLVGTLVVAYACLLMLRSEMLLQLFWNSPWLIAPVALAMIGLGRYAGYRLSEFLRFRDFVRRDIP